MRPKLWKCLNFRVTLGRRSVKQPHSVEWLLAHRQRDMRAHQIQQSRERGLTTDTPTASLYRMYTDIVDDFTIELRNELEYFFNRSDWSVSAIPDPQDPNPARYAILSVLPHLLVPAFNRLISRGLPRDAPAIIVDFEEQEKRPRILEEVPAWCERVPPMDHTLVIPSEAGKVLTDKNDELASPEFLVKNILAFKHHTFFI